MIDSIREMGKFSSFQLISRFRPAAIIQKLKDIKRLEDQKKGNKKSETEKKILVCLRHSEIFL